MKALVKNDVVVDVALVEFAVRPDFRWIDCPDDCVPGWLVQENEPIRPVISPPTNEEIIARFKALIKSVLINKALERNYDSDLSCVSYVNSSNLVWKQEAEAFSQWRDAVYEYSFSVLDAIQQGGQQPTIDDFIAGLPAITWP